MGLLDILKQGAGTGAGALNALIALQSGQLLPLLQQRASALDDPTFRQALTQSPFLRGFSGVGSQQIPGSQLERAVAGVGPTQFPNVSFLGPGEQPGQAQQVLDLPPFTPGTQADILKNTFISSAIQNLLSRGSLSQEQSEIATGLARPPRRATPSAPPGAEFKREGEFDVLRGPGGAVFGTSRRPQERADPMAMLSRVLGTGIGPSGGPGGLAGKYQEPTISVDNTGKLNITLRPIPQVSPVQVRQAFGELANLVDQLTPDTTFGFTTPSFVPGSGPEVNWTDEKKALFDKLTAQAGFIDPTDGQPVTWEDVTSPDGEFDRNAYDNLGVAQAVTLAEQELGVLE